MSKKQLKKSLILSLLVFAVLSMQPVVNAEDILPVFDYESTQSFQPDMKTKKPETVAKPVEKPVVEEKKPHVVAEDVDVKPVQFQLADPKKPYIPGVKVLNPTITVKEEKLKITPKPEDKTETVEKPQPKPVKVENVKPEHEKETITLTEKPDSVDLTLEEETKKLQEQKQKLEQERLRLEAQLKEKELEQKKIEEEKRKAEIKRKKQELARKRAEEKAKRKEAKRKAKEARKQAELARKQKEEAKRKEEAERLAKIEKQKLEEEAERQAKLEKQRLEEEKKAKEELAKKETKPVVEEKPVTTKEDKKENTENVLVIEEKTDTKPKDDDVDFYLKKYTENITDENKQPDLKFSLLDPFKKSLFYTVLKDNKYETIQVKTRDVTADSTPEAVVSYNVPLGGDGDYACQLMVLQPQKQGLAKLWVSELIPGEIDTVMVQDINDDGKNDIVVISTTGGVSLLKSIRVYSYDTAKGTFKTTFAMNGIMEGIVSVKSGKILISETFPGGVNRAALYVWNGRRFERLEL